MLRSEDLPSARHHTPFIDGKGTPLQMASLVDTDTFSFPPHLLESTKIARVLELVMNKYLFYLLAGAAHPTAATEITENIYHKISHTNDVVKAAIEVYAENEELSLEDAVCLALAHDLSRAVQGWFFNKYSDSATRMNHAEAGAKAYAQFFPEDTKLIDAIFKHNQLAPDNPTYAVRFIRDIDKISIWRRIFDTKAATAYKSVAGDNVSNIVVTYFSNKKSVPREHVISEADDWICSLAWIWDLNFQKARLALAQEHLPEKILAYIQSNFTVKPHQVVLLKNGIAEWYQHFELGTANFLPARPNSRRE